MFSRRRGKKYFSVCPDGWVRRLPDFYRYAPGDNQPAGGASPGPARSTVRRACSRLAQKRTARPGKTNNRQNALCCSKSELQPRAWLYGEQRGRPSAGGSAFPQTERRAVQPSVFLPAKTNFLCFGIWPSFPPSLYGSSVPAEFPVAPLSPPKK